jgi:hypothetical protein
MAGPGRDGRGLWTSEGLSILPALGLHTLLPFDRGWPAAADSRRSWLRKMPTPSMRGPSEVPGGVDRIVAASSGILAMVAIGAIVVALTVRTSDRSTPTSAPSRSVTTVTRHVEDRKVLCDRHLSNAAEHP